MSKIFLNYFTPKRILLVCFLFFLTPFATYNIPNLVSLFLTSNYIPTVLNVAYIIFAYTRTSMVEDISVFIIQRIGIKNYHNLHFKLSFTSLLIFCLLLYGTSFIFFEMPIGYEKLVFTFLIFNTLIYIIEELVILLQVNNEKNMVYIMIPLAINFIFRYIIVMPIVNHIFN